MACSLDELLERLPLDPEIFERAHSGDHRAWLEEAVELLEQSRTEVRRLKLENRFLESRYEGRGETIGRLHEKRRQLKVIVRDLADYGPPEPGDGCDFCGALSPEPTEHDGTCLWRQAKAVMTPTCPS
jgi:hypothetical protein